MKALIPILLLLISSCSAAAPDGDGSAVDGGTPDAGADMPVEDTRPDGDDGGTDETDDMNEPLADGGSSDMSTPDMMVEPQPFTFALGDGDPFVAWSDGVDLPVVAGIQGGFHTEHLAFVDLSLDDATDATVFASVEIDGEEVANGGWIFDRSLWTEVDGGYTTGLPVLVFGEEPPYDVEAELLGRIELVDGREEAFAVNVVLVPAEEM